MSVKKTKPTTPGRRQAVFSDFSEMTKSGPRVKSLMKTRKSSGGRNNQGKITVRHRGSGVKRRYRVIDFKRDKFDVPAKVESIEYDPSRGARIALLVYSDGDKRYVVAPEGLKVGDQVLNSRNKIDIKKGNCMPVKHIPAGVEIFCVELNPGQGAKIARGAGDSVYVMGVEGDFAQLKMPSGEIRLVKKDCLCTIGSASNADKRHIKYGLAGRKRKMGIRPTVRGSAMNPIDHPHGGGEGNQPIGLKNPKTPWGKPALGVKTRGKKASDKFIIKRRKKKKR